MKNIIWSEEDSNEENLTCDLCGEAYGKYVDVTRDSQNKWSVLFNCVRLKQNIDTREEAKNWVENADILEELSNARHY